MTSLTSFHPISDVIQIRIAMMWALPCKACNLFRDFRQTISMADRLYFFQQIGPMYPTVNQHQCTGTYRRKKDLQEIRLPVLHSVYSGQELKENWMFGPNHLHVQTVFHLWQPQLKLRSYKAKGILIDILWGRTKVGKKTTYQWSQICRAHLVQLWEVFQTKILEKNHHFQFCSNI